MTTKNKVLVGVGVVAAIVAVWFFFFRKKPNAVVSKVTKPAGGAPSTSPSTSAIGVASQGIKALTSAPSSIGSLFSSSDDSSTSSDDTQADDDDS